MSYPSSKSIILGDQITFWNWLDDAWAERETLDDEKRERVEYHVRIELF
jgi:hypothetical protein